MQKVTINVTQEDINAGRRSVCSNTECPIALALKRVFSKHYVNMGYATFHLDGKKYFEVSESAKRFQMSLFTDGDAAHVKPFKFTVEVPEQYAPATAVPEKRRHAKRFIVEMLLNTAWFRSNDIPEYFPTRAAAEAAVSTRSAGVAIYRIRQK